MGLKKSESSKIHYGWLVVLIVFVTLMISAGIRSIPGIFIMPFEEEFGWSRSEVSTVVAINIFLYGLTGPFAAAWMERFGIRRTMVASLLLLAVSLSLTPFMNALWQFDFLWGIVVGVGVGSLANVLGVTVANRWFVKQKGLVVGMLTASAATGQLLFLPLLAKITEEVGWRYSVYAAVAALVVLLPIVAVWMRNHPYDIGVAPYGSDQLVKPPAFQGNLFLEPFRVLRIAYRSKTFWLLAGSFFICGFTTNGLIGTHLIAACGDFDISMVTGAGLLALMGVFDLLGTTISGWLSDRFDNRLLLFWYYGLRGLSLIYLPQALGLGPMHLFVFAVFYGLDWIATVPPTAKLTTEAFGKERAGMVFGWIVVSHQLGASTAAYFSGVLRDWFGDYIMAFVLAGFLCFCAAMMSTRIRMADTAIQRGLSV